MSKYSLCFGSPTTEAVGSDIHKTFGINGYSRWSTNLYQASNSKDLTSDTPSIQGGGLNPNSKSNPPAGGQHFIINQLKQEVL